MIGRLIGFVIEVAVTCFCMLVDAFAAAGIVIIVAIVIVVAGAPAAGGSGGGAVVALVMMLLYVGVPIALLSGALSGLVFRRR